jgi:hypothetical protein
MQFTRWIGSGPGFIEQHTPGRVAVVIRCGPGFGVIHEAWLDAVHSMDPLRAGFRCDPWGLASMQFTRWIRCGPGFIEQHTPGRVAVVIRCGPWFRCDPWDLARCSSLDDSATHNRRFCNLLQSHYIIQQNENVFSIAVHPATKRKRF